MRKRPGDKRIGGRVAKPGGNRHHRVMRWPAILPILTNGGAIVPAGADLAQVARGLADHPAVPGGFVGWTTARTQAMAVAGVRRVDGADAVREGDLWHIGSLTKSMTATLAARLVDRGLIGWDSTVGAVLGDAVADVHPAWRDMPLDAFLRHASGMAANLGRRASIRLGQGPRAEYVSRVLAQAPKGARGGFLYSNAGYVVVGAMLEAAGGTPWETLIAREVFAPLGLGTAGFGPPEGAAPWGHRLSLIGGLGPVAPGPEADNIAALGPAGRVHLSGADMLRYLRAHLVGESGFLSPESWARLHAPQGPGDYAMGWVARDGVLRHSGSNTMWFAQMRLCPGDGVAVFVAVNAAALGLAQRPVDAAAEAARIHALSRQSGD
jgi:D-alanyl-D-alanine carboxypeptidase